MKKKAVSAVSIEDGKLPDTSIVDAQKIALPGEAKHLKGAYICYTGYAQDNFHGVNQMSVAARERGFKSYVFEFDVIYSSENSYVKCEDLGEHDGFCLAHTDNETFKAIAAHLVEHGFDEEYLENGAILSRHVDVDEEVFLSKGKPDRMQTSNFLVENPEAMVSLRKAPLFSNKRVISVPYTIKEEGGFKSYLISYIFEGSAISGFEEGYKMAKLGLSHDVAIRFPMFLPDYDPSSDTSYFGADAISAAV